MSLIDKAFLYEQCPDVKVQTLSDAINVRGVGNAMHQCNTFAVLDFFIPSKAASGKAVLAQISREVHIVDRLKAKVLIGMDIIRPERMSANINTKLLTIRSCEGTIVPVTITPRPNSKVRRSIQSHNKMTVQPHALIQVPIKIAGTLPSGRDLSFQPEYNSNTSTLRQAGAIYAHVVDANMSFIQVRNNSDIPIVIPRHARLGMVTELKEEGCYAADTKDHKLAGWKPDTSVRVGGAAKTTRLTNGVTIHRSEGSSEVLQLSKACEAFPEVWSEAISTIDIPPAEQLRIPLVDEWQSTKLTTKVYPLSQKDRDFVDKEFDKLHEQGRMDWTTQPTPFGFPVFVVWRTVHVDGIPQRKGRVVVDIRGLNAIAIKDSYPLPLQTDIISAVRGCRYISIIDCASFFFQWLVAEEDRHKFTVVTHRG